MEVTYESVVILQERLTKTEYDKAVENLALKLVGVDCSPLTKISLYDIDKLGKKNLAYEIKENRKGWYVVFTFTTESDDPHSSALRNIENMLRTDDDVIKFIVIRNDDKEIADKSVIIDNKTQK